MKAGGFNERKKGNIIGDRYRRARDIGVYSR